MYQLIFNSRGKWSSWASWLALGLRHPASVNQLEDGVRLRLTPAINCWPLYTWNMCTNHTLDTWKWKKTHEWYKGVLRNQNNPSYSENTAVPGQSCSFLRRSMSAAHVLCTGHWDCSPSSISIQSDPCLHSRPGPGSTYVSYTLKVPQIILYTTERGKSASLSVLSKVKWYAK